MEAFLEAYHVVATHPQGLPSTGEHASQCDVFDEGDAAFSRLITPQAVPSQHDKNPSAYGAVAASWAILCGFRADKADGVPEEIKDRASLAEWRRRTLGETTRADYSSVSDAAMLDSIEYWAFPNFCPWYGEGLPLSYQFRPSADSPDECFMDSWLLIRQPDHGPPMPAAKMVKLRNDEPYSSRPEMAALAEIFDQDDANLSSIQVGLKTWSGDPEGLTLGRYQESRIRFFHQVLTRVLGRP